MIPTLTAYSLGTPKNEASTPRSQPRFSKTAPSEFHEKDQRLVDRKLDLHDAIRRRSRWTSDDGSSETTTQKKEEAFEVASVSLNARRHRKETTEILHSWRIGNALTAETLSCYYGTSYCERMLCLSECCWPPRLQTPSSRRQTTRHWTYQALNVSNSTYKHETIELI